MGMSASQARLLTITARIHDVENEAQRIQNQKLSLANDSDQAYKEYLDAISKKDIQHQVFNAATGECDFVDSNFAGLIDEGYAFKVKQNGTGDFVDCYSYQEVTEALGITGSVEDTKELLSDLVSHAAVLICNPNEVEGANIVGKFASSPGKISSITRTGLPSGSVTATPSIFVSGNPLAPCTINSATVGVVPNTVQGLAYKLGSTTITGVHHALHMDDPEHVRQTALGKSISPIVFDNATGGLFLQWGKYNEQGDWEPYLPNVSDMYCQVEQYSSFSDFNSLISGFSNDVYNPPYFDFIPSNIEYDENGMVESVTGDYYLVTDRTDDEYILRWNYNSSNSSISSDWDELYDIPGQVLGGGGQLSPSDSLIMTNEVEVNPNPEENQTRSGSEGVSNPKYPIQFQPGEIKIKYKDSGGVSHVVEYELVAGKSIYNIVQDIAGEIEGLSGSVATNEETKGLDISWTGDGISGLKFEEADGNNPTGLAELLGGVLDMQQTEGYYYTSSPLADDKTFVNGIGVDIQPGVFTIKVGSRQEKFIISEKTTLEDLIGEINATGFVRADINDDKKLVLETTSENGCANSIQLIDESSTGLKSVLEIGSSSSTGNIGYPLSLTITQGKLYGNTGLNKDIPIEQGGLKITVDGQSEVFTIDASTTIDSLMDDINNSGLGLKAELDDKTGEFSIVSNGPAGEILLEDCKEYGSVIGPGNFAQLLKSVNYTSNPGQAAFNGYLVQGDTVICNNTTDFVKEITQGSFTIEYAEQSETFTLNSSTTVNDLCTAIMDAFDNEVLASFVDGKFIIKAANGKTPLRFSTDSANPTTFLEVAGYVTPGLTPTTVAVELKLREVSDETDIARAEAEYEAALKKIDRKDDKYDKELAAIENQRKALTNEMDTLNTCIDENVDRTFKLFS